MAGSKAEAHQSVVPVTRGTIVQLLALLVCLLFGLAIIANTQLQGESSWFWYATLLHQGSKLYTDLHLPLQPLFVLETDAWMQVFGRGNLALAAKSVLHVFVLSVGFFLALRSSNWPASQKAIVLASAFILFLQAPAYRFDDYHVLAQTCILYSLVGLLRLPRAEARSKQASLGVCLGVLAGLAMTTRLNDGAALLGASSLCAWVLVPRRKLMVLGAILLSAGITVLAVVALTGDSMTSYVSSSMFQAAANKGGTGSIVTYPFLLFRHAGHMQLTVARGTLLFLAATVAIGLCLKRWWQRSVGQIVLVQITVAAGVLFLLNQISLRRLLLGSLISDISMTAILATYALAPFIALRAGKAMSGRGEVWNRREILLFLPLAEMASASASTAGLPLQGFFAQTALCLLLLPIIWPSESINSVVRASFITFEILLGVSGVTSKCLAPYTWQNYDMARMFTNRVWYRSSVNGPMYIERDLLSLSESICESIDKGSDRDLLSLPFSYPNYFCGITPWHGYVQTYFDTSTRASINHLISELETSPPEWIIYQRQLEILRGQEGLYGHWHPLAQRDLDTLIMQKLATGEWVLVEKRHYLVGDGWFVIRTHSGEKSKPGPM